MHDLEGPSNYVCAFPYAPHITLGLPLFVCCLPLVAAEVAESRLPPPSNITVEFDRDIKPIFEKSCLRCHGPEKPKSHFRLDHREAALKGGDNHTDDIVPGDGARSRLVHNVARLVEDMEMPPLGKGEALTPEQIGLLRAWIDQGANWGATNQAGQTGFSISPTLRWISVSGDEKKFRELEGLKEGWAGGVEHFELKEQIGPNKRFSAEGRAVFDDHDVQLKLMLEKTDVGFIRVGVEQWRRYYDDTGGFYRPLGVPSYSLDRDLYVEHDRAWIDLGLTLPHWPQMVLGYEYQAKQGTESTLEWGTVSDPVLDSKNIYPASKDVDERVHILKFDLTHELSGWRIEDSARIEIYDLKTLRDDTTRYTVGPRPDTLERAQDGASHVQGANTIRMEKQLRDWWLVSGGYLFSKFEGDSSFNQTTLDAGLLPASGRFWNTENIVLRRDSHVFSLANLLVPMEGLSGSAGFQSEWTRQEGFGNIHLDFGDPNVPGSFVLNPATAQADLDRSKTMENVGLRFAKIPHTVLFAEARFEQESVGQFERQDGDPQNTFLRDTDAANTRRDWRAGFNTSPWSWISLGAHYRGRASDTDYDHRSDIAFDSDGYSAFITGRKIAEDGVQAKLVLRPAAWLKTTLSYELRATDYSTSTDPLPGDLSPGGRILAGNYDANIYGFSVVLTPLQRVYFSGTFTYSATRTETAQNGDPSIVAYEGDNIMVMASATCTLNAATTLNAAYTFSRADFSQHNLDAGLPLGVNFIRHGLMAGLTRRFNKRITGNLRYGFYRYSEPDSGGVDDYTAHGVFCTLTYQWQ